MVAVISKLLLSTFGSSGKRELWLTYEGTEWTHTQITQLCPRDRNIYLVIPMIKFICWYHKKLEIHNCIWLATAQSHGKSFSFVILSLNSLKSCLKFFSLQEMLVVLCQPTLFYLGFYLKDECLRSSSVFAHVLTLFLEKWVSQF